MSKLQREKGIRAERKIVALYGELGVKAERVPLSGAVRYQGNGADVDVYAFGPDAAPLIKVDVDHRVDWCRRYDDVGGRDSPTS
jgi:Holliday junction resolvase